MKIKYITGDITNPINSNLKIIPHVCNNVGVMGAGVALALSKKWPEVHQYYREWYCNTDLCSAFIGEFALGKTQFVSVSKNILVANMIAQTIRWGPNNEPPIRYLALQECMDKVKKTIFYYQNIGSDWIEIHAPRFGAGLAGGDWNKIEGMIKKTWCSANIQVFIYDLP